MSLIFCPPLPMSEPHWLAGITSLMLTGQVIGTPGVGGVVAKSYNPDKSVMTDNSQISGLKGIDNNSKFLDTGFAAR